MCLCFRNMKKMNSWQDVISWFEFRAQRPPLTLVLFIIFVVYYILTCANWFSWQAQLLVKYMTWVRAPGLHSFHVFFPLILICSISVVDHHISLYPAIHASNVIHPRARIWRLWQALVNVLHVSKKVHKARNLNGPDC